MQATTFEHIVTILFAILFCAYTNIASAGYYEPYEHLGKLAKDFVTKNVNIDPEDTLNVKVSSDLTIPKVPVCKLPIHADMPANTNLDQVTGVELTCNDQPSWHVLVPVNVEIMTKVLVAKQPILPKQEITEELLDYASYDKNSLFNSYYKNKDEIIGQIATHMISAGTVFTRKNLQAPVLIHKNEVVNLVARSHAVSVSMQGIAKSDGCLHDTVKVYNPVSKRVIDAVVAGPNRAESIA